MIRTKNERRQRPDGVFGLAHLSAWQYGQPQRRSKTMSDIREKGLRIFEEVYGEAAAEGLRQHMQSNDFGVEMAKWSTDFAFGTVWARAAMERKLRSAAVLGMMIALRQHNEIAYHTKMGLANGLTRQEIEEILYTAVPYCGLPAANAAKAAMQAAFLELDRAKPD
jgi:alkylhydroperoxidase/carboxymuconolactone decarboxylase family protein YurZ